MLRKKPLDIANEILGNGPLDFATLGGVGTVACGNLGATTDDIIQHDVEHGRTVTLLETVHQRCVKVPRRPAAKP